MNSTAKEGHVFAGRKRFSSNRTLVLDTLHFARGVPMFPVEMEFDLQELAALRRQAGTRISWSVLFLKAYGIVVAQRPVLRQVYVPWPLPHVYGQAETVAALAIHREHQGEDRLCWGRFPHPQSSSLVEMQAALDRYQGEPVGQVFRRQVRFSRFPGWLRRLAWRIGLIVDLAKRAKRFGTFSVSSIAGQGAVNRFHPTIHTTSLTYGPLDERGRCLVTLLCDHRILDGMAAVQALRHLELVLKDEITTELCGLSQSRMAA
jgi:hypothetical protein